jgi:hypothetical protein
MRGCFLERHGIYAIPQAAGRGTVGEYVTEMRVAGVADSFYPFQDGGSVKAVRNCIECHRFGE